MDEPMLPDRYLNPPVSMDWIDILGKKIMLFGDVHTKPTPQNTPTIDGRWGHRVRTESIRGICERISLKVQSKGVLHIYLEDSLHYKNIGDNNTLRTVRKQLYELQSVEQPKENRTCYVHRVDIRTFQDIVDDSGFAYLSSLCIELDQNSELSEDVLNTIEQTIFQLGDSRLFYKTLLEFLLDDNPIDETMLGRNNLLFETLARIDLAYSTIYQRVRDDQS